MRFASLGSGSKGNATLVEAGDALVLVDCGFSVRETRRRLARLGHDPHDLSAVLVTHEHSDHIRGVASLARQYDLPVYMTAGTRRGFSGETADLREVRASRPERLNGLKITPVAVPHDAREPVQYVFEWRDLRLGVLTDLGHVSAHVAESFGACDALLLEANHDSHMLAVGPYPPGLKRRVGGRWGHLSNDQAAGLLAQIDCSRLQSLVLAHISEKNNHREKVAGAIADYSHRPGRVTYACQNEGVHWQVLD